MERYHSERYRGISEVPAQREVEGVGCEIDNDFRDDGDAETIGFGGHAITGAKGLRVLNESQL